MPRKPTAPNPRPNAFADDSGVQTTVNLTRRRLKGCIVLGIAVILFLALTSYDWHDISWLSNPPSADNNHLPVNRIGSLGAWLTFFGYGFAGLAYRYFAIPLLVLASAMMLYGKTTAFRLRVVWMILLYCSLACLFQTIGGDDGQAIPLLTTLNLLPNAGGAIGQLVVTTFLRPLIGSLGLHLLLWSLILTFTLLIIGIKNAVFLLTRLVTPPPVETLAPGVEALTEQAKARDRAQVVESQPKGLFARLFNRGDAEPEAGEEEVPTATEILKRRSQLNSQSWVPPAQPQQAAPLFERPQPEVRVEAEPEAEVKVNVKPEPKTRAKRTPPPPAEPTPFALSSEDAPILKPVSPEKSITAPVPAAHDNTELQDEVPDYGLPPIDLLGEVPPRKNDASDIHDAIAAIENVFQQFRIGAKVVNYKRGPVLTQFEIRPDDNVDLKKFEGTRRNLLMNLRAESIRIQAPIPGRDVVGIEVPNTIRQSVTLREILEGDAWKEAERKMELPLALGKLATGGDLIVDLAEMPHLLVAGGTGSGKSVAVNDMLIGLLMCRKPDRLRLLMVDPKRVEFTSYDNLPHLLNPVVVEPKKVMFTLRWARMEMERRYELLQRYSVRNIGEYNQRVDNPVQHRDNPIQKLPFIVLIIDELADLMNDNAVRAEIETPIAALTAKARAAGIHLIIATQRPTTDIITGTIKSNIPGRVALRVAQANDSRTILDESGAENLIGKGDMLLGRAGKPTVRSQAAWVTNEAIDDICNFIRNQAAPAFDHVLVGTMDRIPEEKATRSVESLLDGLVTTPKDEPMPVEPGSPDDTSDEGYYQRALELIRRTGRFSTSTMQRRFSIGYTKAGRITDMLEERGIIGPMTKGGTREILVDLNAEERQQMAGTDGEAAAFDTRTDAPDAEPVTFDPMIDDVEPATAYVDEGETRVTDPTTEGIDDFSLGDFDPASLDLPEITRPSNY